MKMSSNTILITGATSGIGLALAERFLKNGNEVIICGRRETRLQEIKQMGAVKFIGCSSTAPHLRTYISWGVFDVFQIPYSALERRHENQITEAGQAGAGIIIRGGVARGEPGSGLGAKDRWATYEKAKLDELRAPGESRTAFLLRYTLSHPYCHTTIVGTVQTEHLQENVSIAEKGTLPADVYAEAKRRLDEAGEQPE